MIPVSVPGSQTTSFTSDEFKLDSLISPVLRSMRLKPELLPASSNEYCDQEKSATEPSGLGSAALRRTVLRRSLLLCQLHASQKL